MRTFKTSIAALALMGLSACANNPFGSTADEAVVSGGTTALGAEGGVIQEGSIAFFNQRVGDTVQFVVDQSSLSPEAIATLNGQADFLVQNTQYTAVVEGHADEQGTREYNLGLGARRASSVFNYLVSRGVAENRLETVTLGKERPLATCSDESCWSQNRRAQTVVSGGGFGS